MSIHFDKNDKANHIASSRWDRLGIWLSTLCILHCLATFLLIGFFSTAGYTLADPIFHEIGLALAIIIALFAFGRAWRERGPTPPTALAMGGILLMISALIISHGIAEIILTILGVATLGTGHFLNYRGYRGQH